jgi:hypothetical protein
MPLSVVLLVYPTASAFAGWMVRLLVEDIDILGLRQAGADRMPTRES